MSERGQDIHLHDPQTLYEHWERSQWSPFELDLSRDRSDWAAMDARTRALVLFALSSLMVAEERITTQFTGLVMAHDSEEEATFLATQQVDEARHMQHYARVQNEVIGDPAAIAAHVERSRAHLSDAFHAIFDDKLAGAHERLVASPRDRGAKVDFVTTYHLVIEGTLGLTSFHFITRVLERLGVLPGFVAGYTLIHRDEQRHIGYGIWYLREAVRADPALRENVRRTVRELLAPAAAALAPPGEIDPALAGASPEEIQEFALTGLSRRMNIVGVPLSTL